MMHHNAKEGRPCLKCRYCDFYSLRNSSLPQHEILHPEYVRAVKSIYQCDKCPFETKMEQLLKAHETRHQRVCKYKCRYCDYYMMKVTFMDRHEMLHAEYKPQSSQPEENIATEDDGTAGFLESAIFSGE